VGVCFAALFPQGVGHLEGVFCPLGIPAVAGFGHPPWRPDEAPGEAGLGELPAEILGRPGVVQEDCGEETRQEFPGTPRSLREPTIGQGPMGLCIGFCMGKGYIEVRGRDLPSVGPSGGQKIRGRVVVRRKVGNSAGIGKGLGGVSRHRES